MYRVDSSSPVKDVQFGEALQISLNHYYDLLKTQVGGLNSDEVIQLKLVADNIDLSNKNASEGGYRWWSYYNLLNRSDRAIVPMPVDGEVTTGLETLHAAYEKFIQKLLQYAVRKELTDDEQKEVADLKKRRQNLNKQVQDLYIADFTNWKEFATAMGYDVGDRTAYVQWSSRFGNLQEIESITKQIEYVDVKKRRILDKEYPNSYDKEIIDAEFAFYDPASRIRYPVHPDHLYGDDGDRFNLPYLARLPLGSTGQFDDRRVGQWDKDISSIKSNGAGAFEAEFDKDTAESTTIETDWKASGSVKYGFIKVKASVSEYRRIQKDFLKGTNIKLSAKSAQRVNMTFPNWFRPNLFSNHYVQENPYEFLEFFGESGSLRYYPTALLLVRGFSVEFESVQDWTYDFKSRFSAKGGGGFRAFGINFGGSAHYSKNVKEHKVDQSTTTLKISDDENTLRFVGYTVKEMVDFPALIDGKREKVIGDGAGERK